MRPWLTLHTCNHTFTYSNNSLTRSLLFTSGKSTSLRNSLCVFGAETKHIHGADTAPAAIVNKASSTTIPLGQLQLSIVNNHCIEVRPALTMYIHFPPSSLLLCIPTQVWMTSVAPRRWKPLQCNSSMDFHMPRFQKGLRSLRHQSSSPQTNHFLTQRGIIACLCGMKNMHCMHMLAFASFYLRNHFNYTIDTSLVNNIS